VPKADIERCYSITSLACASTDGGTASPSAFAVFRLIASSYLVGACTGRSAGSIGLGGAVQDRYILAFDKARLLEALSEAAQLVLVQRYGGEEPDHRHRLPLRPRGERPRRRGEGNSLNEITSSHCPLTIAPTYGVQLQQEFLTDEMGFWVKLHSSNFESRMSALGQKQTLEAV
jgi:hypothetical protein